jgi:hypothetical protein
VKVSVLVSANDLDHFSRIDDIRNGRVRVGVWITLHQNGLPKPMVEQVLIKVYETVVLGYRDHF